MQYDNATTGDQVSILLRQPGLSSDETSREALLHDLELAVEAVLADHGLDADRTKIIGGHCYASVEAACPRCGDRLQLVEAALDSSNGAAATATCDCGWHGDAIYRLIDLCGSASRGSERDDAGDNTDVDRFENDSSVREGKSQPQYYPY